MIKKLKLKIGQLGIRLIRFTARKAKLDLIRIAYSENGISKSYNLTASGEHYFISNYLPTIIKSENPVLFDVGANVGEYANLLRKTFRTAEIHSFEPNPSTFLQLQKNCPAPTHCINLGIGENSREIDLFFDSSQPTSVQATSDPEILKTIAKPDQITAVKIQVSSMDDYCEQHQITQIDLLKIDIEGFELEALKGAKNLLANGAIKAIQFEFNEVNIVKRRFLKDFFDLLPGFDFYRLDEKRLIPLNEWQPIHEIFLFQYIVAIKK